MDASAKSADHCAHQSTLGEVAIGMAVPADRLCNFSGKDPAAMPPEPA